MWHEQVSGEFVLIAIIWSLFNHFWVYSKVKIHSTKHETHSVWNKETNALQKTVCNSQFLRPNLNKYFIEQCTTKSFDFSLRICASPPPSLSGKWFWFVPKRNFPAPNTRRPFSRFFTRCAIHPRGTIFYLLIIKIYLVYFIWTHSIHFYLSSFSALKSAHKNYIYKNYSHTLWPLFKCLLRLLPFAILHRTVQCDIYHYLYFHFYVSKLKKVWLFMIPKRGRFSDKKLVGADFHRQPGPRISVVVVHVLELAEISMSKTGCTKWMIVYENFERSFCPLIAFDSLLER